MSLDNAITQSVLIAEATVSILAEEVERLERRIEDAKQRLEQLNGTHVGRAELYTVIEILEGKK
jgi:tetrahydromethanopterin S-methyltransferase subunit G